MIILDYRKLLQAKHFSIHDLTVGEVVKAKVTEINDFGLQVLVGTLEGLFIFLKPSLPIFCMAALIITVYCNVVINLPLSNCGGVGFCISVVHDSCIPLASSGMIFICRYAFFLISP